MEVNHRSTIHSLAKALELMDILTRNRAPMSLQELAGASGYPKSTIHTLLSTMRQYNYIEQRPDGRYYLGTHLFECGCAVSGAWDISTAARPHLEALSAATQCTAVLSCLEHGSVIHIDQCADNGSIRIVQEIGSRLPLHATSQGKLMLSTLSQAEVVRLLSLAGMPAFTPHTITEIDALLPALQQIRAKHYAVENGEYKIGLRSIAAPVYDRDGHAHYALGVVGLFRRIDSEEFSAAVEQVLAAAKQLSADIGCCQAKQGEKQ